MRQRRRIRHLAGNLREILWAQLVTVTQDDRAEDGIFQLTDIARPVKGIQDLHRVIGHAGHFRAFAGIEAVHEMINQGRNIVAALTQGRHVDRIDIEAIEQVFAERALGNLLRQIPVGCRNDAHIHLGRAA